MGFTGLMFGMNLMSSAVTPLVKKEEFRNILIRFSTPFLGVMSGAIVTAMIQS